MRSATASRPGIRNSRRASPAIRPDDPADADRDDAGGADDDEPARQQADGIDTSGERRQEEREPVELVARVERCETREDPFNAAPPPPGFAGAQPGLQRSSPAAPPA